MALDLDQIRADLSKLEATDPPAKVDDSGSWRNVGFGHDTTSTNAFGIDNDNQGKAHNIHAPPPVRALKILQLTQANATTLKLLILKAKARWEK
ncbi:hypothetical protein D1007_20736 [Hordeum vulgare]|nr:hypothetical protein D1007_20736 [Hordeum vulgare]